MTGTPQDAASPPPISEAVFQILLALADQERHGYGIMREVAERTAGRVRLGPGTIYGAIKRLCEQGLLEETEVEQGIGGDERRRHYRLTRQGREVAMLEAKRLEHLVAEARGKNLLPRPVAT